tara:strand:- start:1245 stop:1718 length:474 start_codon:yes stop_codon:yes gene_type:complete
MIGFFGRHFLVSLSLLAVLTGCAFDPICPCEKNTPNPCREEDDDLFPTQVLMRSYEGSALGGLIPLKARLTPARALYALLENGNKNDAATWVVGDDKEYSGYFEVFPPTQKGTLICRKFTQEMTIKTHDYGDRFFKGQGESCKNPPNTWRVVKEVQP